MHISDLIRSVSVSVRSGARLDAVRDWLVLLTLSVLALVSIVVWNVWAFDTVAGGGTIGASTTRAPAVFNRTALEEIRVIFEDRALERAKYETGVYHFADPSQ